VASRQGGHADAAELGTYWAKYAALKRRARAVLKTPSGSSDISSGVTWNNGIWTVELKRSSSRATQMTSSLPISRAVHFANGRGRGPLLKSGGNALKFEAQP